MARGRNGAVIDLLYEAADEVTDTETVVGLTMLVGHYLMIAGVVGEEDITQIRVDEQLDGKAIGLSVAMENDDSTITYECVLGNAVEEYEVDIIAVIEDNDMSVEDTSVDGGVLAVTAAASTEDIYNDNVGEDALEAIIDSIANN